MKSIVNRSSGSKFLITDKESELLQLKKFYCANLSAINCICATFTHQTVLNDDQNVCSLKAPIHPM